MAMLVITASCDRPAPKPTPQEMTPIKAAPGEVSTNSLEKAPPEVKVKFRRDKDSKCSWEISGDDPEEIIRADAKLRKGVTGTTHGKSE
jgi:hypothetical protein